ncbi:YndM family protein [Oceanobacillus rekensis]|uniref:YndM family protein n=1 Tax=Oceanobacillus rekensis TaxID=937927 RepID=UPI0015934445|nr:YndM family protein [Oceanobacillus rekensis]
MKHVKALGIKFAITAIVLLSILTIFEAANLGEILFMSVLITGTSYIIGDLFILPKLGYFMAAVADFGLATISILGLSALYIGTGAPILIVSLAAGYIMAIGEAIFHIYMKERVLNDGESQPDYFRYRNQMQTEIAEEDDIHNLKHKPKSEKD